MCIMQAADIFGTGIVAGAFVMGAIAVHPAFARLDASHHIILRQEMIRRLQLLFAAFHALADTGIDCRPYTLSCSGLGAARCTRMCIVGGNRRNHSDG